jgi:hypothetical protein
MRMPRCWSSWLKTQVSVEFVIAGYRSKGVEAFGAGGGDHLVTFSNFPNEVGELGEGALSRPAQAV